MFFMESWQGICGSCQRHSREGCVWGQRCLEWKQNQVMNSLKCDIKMSYLRGFIKGTASELANWQVVTAWFDHLEKSFSYNEVQLKKFCLLVKTSCHAVENISKILAYCTFISRRRGLNPARQDHCTVLCLFIFVHIQHVFFSSNDLKTGAITLPCKL